MKKEIRLKGYHERLRKILAYNIPAKAEDELMTIIGILYCLENNIKPLPDLDELKATLTGVDFALSFAEMTLKERG
jgi:hypothetical protein